MEKFKYTEKYMQDCLEGYYNGNVDYYFRNIFLFDSPMLNFYTHWESDFLIIRPNGYITDFEIKCVKSDYLQEFKNKPKKHELLAKKEVTCKGTLKYWDGRVQGMTTEFDKDITGVIKYIPHNFVFVTPPNLITLEELPEYAGLIEINHCGQLEFKKKPPFLHKEKIDYKTPLFNKCYHKWMGAESQIRELKSGIGKDTFSKEILLAKQEYRSASNEYKSALRFIETAPETEILLDLAYKTGIASGKLQQIKNGKNKNQG